MSDYFERLSIANKRLRRLVEISKIVIKGNLDYNDRTDLLRELREIRVAMEDNKIPKLRII